MTMYKSMYELLTSYAPLTALVPVDHIFETGSAEDRPEMPFIVLAWMPSYQSANRQPFSRQFEVHAHDERGSHARLRAVMRAVKDCLEGVAQYQGSDGWITCCEFAGDGGELLDPDTSTNLQFSSWRVVGRTT